MQMFNMNYFSSHLAMITLAIRLAEHAAVQCMCIGLYSLATSSVHMCFRTAPVSKQPIHISSHGKLPRFTQ